MAGSAEKRPREAAGSPPNEERRTKRRRWDTDADPAENNLAPVAPAVTAAPDKTAAAAGKTTVPKQDALAKAKAVLAKQKALAEKLKKANIPVNTTATPSTQSDAVKKALEVAERAKQKKQNAAATSVGRGAPRALRLNAKGEEIDEDGKVVESANVKEISTFAINAKSLAQKEKQAKFDLFAALQRETAAEVYAGDERFVGRRRDRKEFQFVEEGTFQKQADMTRLRAKYGASEARAIANREKKELAGYDAADGDSNAVPLGDGAERSEAVSAAERSRVAGLLPSLPSAFSTEWWDAELVTNEAYEEDVTDATNTTLSVDKKQKTLLNIDHSKITLYVEHPVPFDPPKGGESVVPEPRALMLTKTEQKKLRTQRRVAREMEKQEMIKQGLLEPPPPKVKISNLMRVLTDGAVADPTQIEKQVRAQMAERAEAHEDRNLARQLTPAEKKEKKRRKMFDDTTGDTGQTHIRVYRIESLANPKHRFRVDINAQENHLTGVCVAIEDSFVIVVVEGVSKAIRRYEKLVTKRVDWTAGADDDDDGDADNKCTCVWVGVAPHAHFEGRFKFETIRSHASARKRFQDKGLAHFFDAASAANAAADDAAED